MHGCLLKCYLPGVFSMLSTLKGGRPRDDVWDHYIREERSTSGSHYKARCRYCGKIFLRGKVSLMKVHLAFACGDIPSDVKTVILTSLDSEDAADATTVSSNNDQSSSQPTISNFLSVSTRVNKELKVQFDRELMKFFIGCNIPFNVIENPMFVSFVNKINPGYKLPSRSQMSETLFWEETARVVHSIDNDLKQDRNLTLAVDGWTDYGKSLYAYVIITSDRRIYLHSVKDFSDQSHTADFLTTETLKILKDIGEEKVGAFVTDNAANMKKLRFNITSQFPSIISLRCMPHYVNLITEDIMKHEWPKSLLHNCQLIVKYFSSHHRPRAQLQQCRAANVPELAGFVKTRWYSAGQLARLSLSA